MDEFLRLHEPSENLRRRAEQAGLNLDELKIANPQHYKMLAAQHILEVSAELEASASNVLTAAFRHHEIFRLEQASSVVLLIFPALADKEIDKLDKAAAQLIETPTLKNSYAYFRVVTDKQGEHRQLELPLSPSAWQGQLNRLVGPFNNQAEAEAWGEEHARPQQFVFDTLPYNGAWFCDVFLGS
jgi:hypothetical protein